MILYNSRKTTKDILPAIGYRGEQDHLRKKQEIQTGINEYTVQRAAYGTVLYSRVE